MIYSYGCRFFDAVADYMVPWGLTVLALALIYIQFNDAYVLKAYPCLVPMVDFFKTKCTRKKKEMEVVNSTPDLPKSNNEA